MLMDKKALILILFILSFSFVTAVPLFPEPSVEVGVGFGSGTGQTGVNIFVPREILNTSSINVNNSIFWDGNTYNASTQDIWQRIGTVLSPVTAGDKLRIVEIIDDDDATSIDPINRVLKDQELATKVDWSQEILNDDNEVLSYDWRLRVFYADDGNDEVLKYVTVGLADFGNSEIRTTGNPKIKSDASKAFFGLSDDASIQYNGADMVINPKEVGSGKLKVPGSFEASGTGRFDGGLADSSENIIFDIDNEELRDGNGDIRITFTEGVPTTFETINVKIDKNLTIDGYLGIGKEAQSGNKIEVLDGDIVLREDDDGNNAIVLASSASAGTLTLLAAGSNTIILNGAAGWITSVQNFIGGGFGSSGTTIYDNGNLSMDGDLFVGDTITTPSTITGTTITADGSNSNVFNINKAFVSNSNYLNYRIANAIKWQVGMPDSDNFGAGTEYIIGQTEANPALVIDTSDNLNIRVGNLSLTAINPRFSVGGTPDNQSQIKINSSGDSELMFDSEGDDPWIIGYDVSANKFAFHLWFNENPIFKPLGSFGDMLTIDRAGNLEINPDGFSSGGKISQFSKVASGAGITTIYDSVVDFQAGEGQIGDGQAYLFRAENFEGDGNGARVDMAKWEMSWTDPNTTSEDSKTVFKNMVAGTLTEALIVDGVDVEMRGDLNQTGGNATINMVYGEMWFHNDTNFRTIVISTQNVAVNISFNSSDSEGAQVLNGFGYTEACNCLIAQVSGKYKVDYSISAGNDGNNEEYEFFITINDTVQSNTDAHRKIGSSGDVGNAGGSGFIDLQVGDRINLQVVDRDNTDDLEVHAANVNILRIGD